MNFEFVRHEPLYDRILLVLTLNRQKMKERILIGEELQIRFRLQGYADAEVLCDVTRPLGAMLSAFEHDPESGFVYKDMPMQRCCVMLHALWELCFQPLSMILMANGTVLV